MRTLKFRFYDATQREFKYFTGIWNMPDPSYDFDDIQQFTGLVDRLGVEIYEGDIVTDKWLVDPVVVDYEECGFFPFEYNGGKQVDWEECEVIGNIYDN